MFSYSISNPLLPYSHTELSEENGLLTTGKNRRVLRHFYK